jgi:hypothetical protein
VRARRQGHRLPVPARAGQAERLSREGVGA